MREEAVHQRGRGRPVDIVIPEDRHLLAGLDGAYQPLGGLLAIGQHMRIGHQGADGRIEECQGVIDTHPAPGKNACDQFGNGVNLGHGQRAVLPGLIQPRYPALFCRRPLHA
ncbi:hypothetical protein D3C80_236150 [compost metagenome]